jgi:hypothetical protein
MSSVDLFNVFIYIHTKFNIMKKSLQFLSLICATIVMLSFSSFSSKEHIRSERVNFRIKGTGVKGIDVQIGIGDKPGYGSCCSTITAMSTGGFVGHVGDVVYDGKTNRIITKIYMEMEGTIIDLEKYY